MDDSLAVDVLDFYYPLNTGFCDEFNVAASFTGEPGSSVSIILAIDCTLDRRLVWLWWGILMPIGMPC
jgi:hypothetical protein